MKFKVVINEHSQILLLRCHQLFLRHLVPTLLRKPWLVLPKSTNLHFSLLKGSCQVVASPAQCSVSLPSLLPPSRRRLGGTQAARVERDGSRLRLAAGGRRAATRDSLCSRHTAQAVHRRRAPAVQCLSSRRPAPVTQIFRASCRRRRPVIAGDTPLSPVNDSPAPQWCCVLSRGLCLRLGL